MKLNRYSIASLAVAGVAILTLSSCSAPSSGGGNPASGAGAGTLEGMEPVTITYSDYNSETTALGSAAVKFIEQVEDQSDGKITFETYFNASLVPFAESLDAVSSGLVGMQSLAANSFPEQLPTVDFFSQYSSMTSNAFPFGMLQGAAASNEMYTSDPQLTADLEDSNIKALASVYPATSYNLQCNKPVGSAEDLKGLRARTAGNVWINEVTSLGMTPVPMTILEAYEGLERGVIDCIVLYTGGFIDFSLWDVAPYYVPVTLSTYMPNLLSINLDLWNSLPTDAQAILEDAAFTYFSETLGRNLDGYAHFATENDDLVFEDASAASVIVSEFQQSVIKEALSSSAVDDPKSLHDNFGARLDSWSTALADDLGYMDEAVTDPDKLRDAYASASDLDIEEYLSIVKESSFSQYQ